MVTLPTFRLLYPDTNDAKLLTVDTSRKYAVAFVDAAQFAEIDVQVTLLPADALGVAGVGGLTVIVTITYAEYCTGLQAEVLLLKRVVVVKFPIVAAAIFCVLPPIATQLFAFKVFSFSHKYVAPETEVPLIPVCVPEQIAAGVVRLPEAGAEHAGPTKYH